MDLADTNALTGLPADIIPLPGDHVMHVCGYCPKHHGAQVAQAPAKDQIDPQITESG